MAYILAALALLTVLVMFDLILSFAIIRRLLAHVTRLANLEQVLRPYPGLEPGSQVPDFEAFTVNGELVSRESLRDDVEDLVAAMDGLAAVTLVVADLASGTSTTVP